MMGQIARIQIVLLQAAALVLADRDREDELCSYFETFQKAHQRLYVGRVALGRAVVRLACAQCADAQVIAVRAVDNVLAARLADDALAARFANDGHHSLAVVVWASSKIRTQ